MVNGWVVGFVAGIIVAVACLAVAVLVYPVRRDEYREAHKQYGDKLPLGRQADLVGYDLTLLACALVGSIGIALSWASWNLMWVSP